MPVERQSISASMLAELVGVEPSRFLAVEKLNSTTFAIVLEPERPMQNSGTLPALSDNISRRPPRKPKGGKK